MNDDELRAFLESATVGDDDGGDGRPEESSTRVDATDGSDAGSGDGGAAPEPPAQIPGGAAPVDGLRGAREPATEALSFDELVSGAPNPAPPTQTPESQTPIVLPGPPSRSRRAAAAAPWGPGASAAGPAPTASTAPPTAPLAVAPSAGPASTPPKAGAPAGPVPPMRSAVGATPAAAATAAAATGSSLIAPRSDGYEPISVTGGRSERSRLLPWLIVGAGAVVAILAAVLIVGGLSSGDEPQPAPTETTEPSSETTAQPGTPTTTTTTAPVAPTTTTPSTTVPKVEVGPTMNMPVTQWNIQVDLSQRLGQTFYNLEGEKLLLSTALIDSLPAGCETQPWGMERKANGSFEVLKPAERCAAAPELYDELWGLMDAMVKTARPL